MGISRSKHPQTAAFVLAIREAFGPSARVTKFEEVKLGESDDRGRSQDKVVPDGACVVSRSGCK